ncbi:UDP-glucosyltransferase 2 [Leptinotarsa decemlineata]|uniref:UDP-glucosyltransferase 2 n=1 Tax=Leptinotarsa decemlineata TaxID=7539 RepID=UPI003D308205
MYVIRSIIVCSILSVIHGARILGVFPYCVHSHFSLGFRLMKELADKGHEVTFINSFPQKVPIRNLRDISVEEMKKPVAGYIAKLRAFGQFSPWKQLEFMLSLGRTYTEVVLKNENVQNLLNSNETFDLVIVEHFWNEAMAIFAHRFECPLVYMAPGPTSVFNSHLLANPSFPSYIPNFLTAYSSRMNFWERLRNSYLNLLCTLFVEFRLIPDQSDLLKTTVPNAPDLRTILYNASLMLIMSHASIHDPEPLQPNVKNIGGHHIGPLEPLPANIQQFMDNATEGVIVFSLGSNLKAADLDPAKKTAILSVFSKIKQKVLWKFETDLDEKSSNVMIQKWLPQQEVLSHPNTVAFISHGGLLGCMEAVHFGVPILGLPAYWDQNKNIEGAVRSGIAVKMDVQDLTEHTFRIALEEILNNKKYSRNAKFQSQIMHDRPMKPLDEAVFWLEYVIRYAGAPHLKSAALDLKWYQLYLIDILIFVGLTTIALFLLVFFVIRYISDKSRKYISESKKNK